MLQCVATNQVFDHPARSTSRQAPKARRTMGKTQRRHCAQCLRSFAIEARCLRYGKTQQSQMMGRQSEDIVRDTAKTLCIYGKRAEQRHCLWQTYTAKTEDTAKPNDGPDRARTMCETQRGHCASMANVQGKDAVYGKHTQRRHMTQRRHCA